VSDKNAVPILQRKGASRCRHVILKRDLRLLEILTLKPSLTRMS
jgi:hypothetical protein